ncbi:MAG: citrate/2-methylcitrate synthase [Mycobacteriales bacterium]
MTTSLTAPPGLKGLIVADTALGDVRGQEGFYHYRQYPAPALAAERRFEDAWYLLWEGALPTPDQQAAFDAELRAARRLPPAVLDALPAVAAGAPLTALRTALSVAGAALGLRPIYDLDEPGRRADALAVAALTPGLIAATHRLRHGLAPVPPRDDLGHAAHYLYQLTGEVPAPEPARAVETYLTATLEHGFNASAFTARIVASTGADVASCVLAALGALSGPRHGGAPSRALDSLDAIGTPDRTAAWVRERVLAGDRIMGFGHAVYRTTDPRNTLLRQVARDLAGSPAAAGPDPKGLVAFAEQVEQQVEETLAELKPGRELHANVEFYAGVVMELAGLPRELFTPTFACSRVVGWCAHVLEQARDPRIIRPSARYVGPEPLV